MSPKTKAGGGSKGRGPKDSWLRRSLKKVTATAKQSAAPTTQTPRSPRKPNPLALLPTPRGFDGPQTDRPDGVNDEEPSPPISVRLPLAYLRILNTEATVLGFRRNAFLSMLIRRKIGKLRFERPDDAPAYEFTDEEFEQTKVYLWHCKREIRMLVDLDRRQMGLTSYSAWINIMLNHWIGRPGGLRSEAWRGSVKSQ